MDSKHIGGIKLQYMTVDSIRLGMQKGVNLSQAKLELAAVSAATNLCASFVFNDKTYIAAPLAIAESVTEVNRE